MVRVHSNVDDFPLAKTPTKMKVNILGQVFGKLKPVERIIKIRPNGKKVICYDCECECGNTVLFPMQYLTSGRRKDCGCVKRIVHLDIVDRISKGNDYHKNYRREYTKTEFGFLNKLYYAMASRNREKGFGELPFSVQEFTTKFIKHYSFVKLFENYKNSGFDRGLAPSIDRINPNLGYFYENMQFVTSKENAEKGLQEFKLVKSRPISMYDYKTKELIMKFDCVKDAVTYTGSQQGNISKVLNGNRNKTGGYYFEYDQKEDSDVLTKIKQMLGKE